MHFDVGHIQPDEWDQHFTITSEAFNGPRAIPANRVVPSEQNVLVARAAGALVGVAAIADFGQVFDGEVLPMGGVTAVAVVPEAGGRGVARTLMSELVRLMAERGKLVSLLSPSTATLYRSVGYEHASTFMRREIPLRYLRRDTPDGVTVERAGVEVFDDLRDLHVAHAQRSHGWLIRDDWYWAKKAQAVRLSETHVRIYVARRDGRPLAVAAVKHRDGSTYPFTEYDFELLDVFGEPDGLTAIAATLSRQSTLAGLLHTTMARPDLLAFSDRPEMFDPKLDHPIMGRIVDLRGAVTARGGGHFTEPIHLRVHDDLLPANDGNFVVTSKGDSVEIESGGSGEIELSVGDLASVFSGYEAPITLAARGRLGSRASESAVRAMSRWLACPTPTVADDF